MKYTELTAEDIEKIRAIHVDKMLSWDTKMANICKYTGKSERHVRRWLKKLDISQYVEKASPQFEEAKKRKLDRTKNRFIVTWGQCDTEPHNKFIDNMEAYAKYIGADIHIIAGRYKNPTSIEASNNIKGNESWHSRIVPYLDANRHEVHKYVTILSDIKIQPTATNPMNGLQGMSDINSCVFGYPRHEMEFIPVLEGNRPKCMMTTGSCTQPNYTESRVGAVSEFRHTLGFVVIEIGDGDMIHMRQVSANNNGDFTDIVYEVKKGVVSTINTCEGIVWGDLHYGSHDAAVVDATFDLMNAIKPKTVVLHDVLDGYSINPHESDDPFMQYASEYHGKNNLVDELDKLMSFLGKFDGYENVVITRANHDIFLDRWLKGDWRKATTPKNAKIYMELSKLLMEQYEKTPEHVIGVLPALINNRYPKYKAMGLDDSFKIKGYEVGQHGHIGSSGSRGSVENFRKLNTKIIIGHGHSPTKKENVLMVGTKTKLRMGYNKGASKWAHSDVIIHNTGKAQQIIYSKDANGVVKYTTLI